MVLVFMTSGMNYFNKQSNSINLQNEMQEASNAVTEAIMECNVINAYTTNNGLLMIELDQLKTDSSGTVIRTTEGDYSFTGKNSAKAILFNPDESTLYILDTNGYNKIKNPSNHETLNLKGYSYTSYLVGLSISEESGNYQRGSKVVHVTLAVASSATATDRVTDELTITTRNAVTYTSTVH